MLNKSVKMVLKVTIFHRVLSTCLLVSFLTTVVALPGDKSPPDKQVLSHVNQTKVVNETKKELLPAQNKTKEKSDEKPSQPRLIPLSAKKRVEQVPASASVPSKLLPTSIAPNYNASNITVLDGTIARNFPRVNSGALLRGFYVFVGLGVIVMMYIVVRTVRLRRSKVSRVHKYGILASREDVEMTPLGEEEEDDDTIVFDLSSHPPS